MTDREILKHLATDLDDWRAAALRRTLAKLDAMERLLVDLRNMPADDLSPATMARMIERRLQAAAVGEPAPSTSAITIGTRVQWTSGASGRFRSGVAGKMLTKEGEVVEVVPAGARPTRGIREPGAPRDHESYRVRVKGRDYWPVVSKLEVVK